MKPAHIASTSLYPAMLSSTKPELDCIHAMLKVHQILGKWWISEWCTCDQCAMHLFLLGPSFAASCWIFHSFLLKELTHDILSWLIQLQSLSAQEIPYPLGLMSYIARLEEKWIEPNGCSGFQRSNTMDWMNLIILCKMKYKSLWQKTTTNTH